METEVTANYDSLAPANFFACFPIAPTIETPRLLLRPLCRDDANDIFEYGSDPEVTKYMIWPQHTTLADAHFFLDLCEKGIADLDKISLAIHSKEHNKLIGAIDFHHLSPEHQRIEVGYVLARAYWGFGYMTESLRAMIDFAFGHLGVHRVEANCDAGNIRSYKVMERCGMKLEGISVDHEFRNGRRISLKRYSILNRDKMLN